MREQEDHFFLESSCRIARLTRGRLDTDHDIAENVTGEISAFTFSHRECEDVGWTIFPPIVAIENVYLIVVC